MADKIKGDIYIMEIKDWKTSELVEFLCSYNRLYKDDKELQLKYRDLYVAVRFELNRRSPLIAMVY